MSKAKIKEKSLSEKVSSDKEPKGQVLVGNKLKDFKLQMTGGKSFRLSELKDYKIVLYFYPKDATPGCTQEGHDFSELKSEFKKYKTLVFGISRDSVESHEKFKLKQNYSIDLLSDSESKACGLFDVIKEKNMYGKKKLGIERSTFVIDENQKIIGEWRRVKVEGHAKEVLEFVKGSQ
jgi:peroxiredoxin Q/BCP